MSFVISAHTADGVVIAADSRTVFNRTIIYGGVPIHEHSIHHTDTSDKIFLTGGRIGIASCGSASISGQPCSVYIRRFIDEKLPEAADIDDIPPLLLKYFFSFDPIPDIQFIVAGYKPDGGKPLQRIWSADVKSYEAKLVSDGRPGAVWAGATDTMDRLFSEKLYKKDPQDNFLEIPRHRVAWEYFTLQDAVDFAVYAVRTTMSTQSFQVRYKTVGGPVDVLLITPEKAEWLRCKRLCAPV